jgi:hypothetical protein
VEALLREFEVSPYDAEAAELVLVLPSQTLRAETRAYADTWGCLQIGQAHAVQFELRPWPDERGMMQPVLPTRPTLVQVDECAYRATGVIVGHTQDGLPLMDVGLSEPLACDCSRCDGSNRWITFEGVLFGELSGVTAPGTVQLPAVPHTIRRALLAYWAEEAVAQPGTDQRWISEAFGVDYSYIHEHVHTGAAQQALLRAGIEVGEPVEYMELMRQGSSTFSFIPSRNGDWCIRVTEVVRAVDLGNSGTFRWTRQRDGKRLDLPGPPPSMARDIAHVLSASGFAMLGQACLETVVRGLKVYFFKPDQQLTVEQLLFYWQD